jgi:transposase InsO family protein
MQLLYDNLLAELREKGVDERPSYSSVRRHLRGRGFVRVSKKKAEVRRHHAPREVRSFEVDRVGALWHLDFHTGSRRVVDAAGRWHPAKLLCVLDDHSRLCCHAQWYLGEGVEEIVHGFRQALQKRGVPRALMSDNGSAMIAEEFRRGLSHLGIIHERTLPYHPEQNGKQERFFGTLEGRLMAMLKDERELTLRFLNQATQAWAEMDYNRTVQREIGVTPLERFTSEDDASRPCPESPDLTFAFMREVTRKQKKSTQTISVSGTRYEIPRAYRHMLHVRARFSSWDLSSVWIVDARTGAPVVRLFPEDKIANADGKRRLTEAAQDTEPALPSEEMPPLLRELLRNYAADGRPYAYIPKPEDEDPVP